MFPKVRLHAATNPHAPFNICIAVAQAANDKRFIFNNFPTRCDLFSLLHFCRQLYIFRVLTPITRSLITASGTGQPGLLPSALIVELELIHVYRTVGIHTYLMMDVNTRNM